jgi:hypothetical protein
MLDYGYTTFAGPSAWSFGYDFHWGQGAVVHLYNTQDSIGVATNYERAAFDWFATANIFRVRSQAGGTGTVRLIAYDAFSKAGAPAAGDLPAGTCAFIDDTTNNQTWLVFNKAGTIRKTQLNGAGGGMSIGGAVTGGTPFDVLYVGTGPVLAQDSGFQYTATGQILLGGSQLNLLVNSVSVPVIRSIYNPGGDLNNWFFAQSGNTTATGWGNLGIGQNVLPLLSTGSSNVALGNYSAQVLTTGDSNIAIGNETLFSLVSNSNNVAIGRTALYSCIADGNVAIGTGALINVTTGSYNFALGQNAAQSLVTGNNGVFIGYRAGQNITGGSYNIAIGYQSFSSGTGDSNVVIGNSNFNTVSGSNGNVIIGSNTGLNLTAASSSLNTWVGAYLAPSSVTSYSGTALFGNAADRAFSLDFGIMTSNVWSFEYSTFATGVHIYNTTDGIFSKTNWERAVLDWVTTSNVLTIGTQAGGTGTLRNIKFVKGPTNILDYGVTTANVWTFAFNIAVPGAANPVLTTTAAITTGAGASAGTLTNAPAAGNPTKWIPINDAGTIRYIPAW